VLGLLDEATDALETLLNVAPLWRLELVSVKYTAPVPPGRRSAVPEAAVTMTEVTVPVVV
jgi:hypothetical protein